MRAAFIAPPFGSSIKDTPGITICQVTRCCDITHSTADSRQVALSIHTSLLPPWQPLMPWPHHGAAPVTVLAIHWCDIKLTAQWTVKLHRQPALNAAAPGRHSARGSRNDTIFNAVTQCTVQWTMCRLHCQTALCITSQQCRFLLPPGAKWAKYCDIEPSYNLLSVCRIQRASCK